MQQIGTEKDKQNRPILIMDISDEEKTALKTALEHHPRNNPLDEEDKRFNALLQREELTKLTVTNIIDLKEAVNKYIQDEGSTEIMASLHNDLHEFWKTLRPS